MKRNILILFAVFSLIISLTGCGGSGSSNYVTPKTTEMTSVRVSLTQDGQPAPNAEVILYTPAAAMREGLIQAQNKTNFRGSLIDNRYSEGVYSPVSSDNGIYTFNVPTGDYTLIANRGNARAVLTTIRAEAVAEGASKITVAKLSHTAKIEGIVTVPSSAGITAAGAIVYLERTSFVAITDSDGKFEITGVPAEESYKIAAMSNQNDKYYNANSIDVVVKSDLSVTPTSISLSLNEATLESKVYEIKGRVINGNNGLKDKLVMATDNISFFVAVTDDNGDFTLKVNDIGLYHLTVVGANPESQTVTVNSTPTQMEKSFEISSSVDTYGCVKGNIEYSEDYLNYLNNNSSSLKVPDVGRYLVQLIGVDGTSYRTQTRADYNYSEVSAFMFDNVYPGTYTVLVDPAGNGFVGSIGTFTVKAGQTTDLGKTATATVTFVQPTFTTSYVISSNVGMISILAEYPFFIVESSKPIDAKVIIRNLSDNTYIYDAILSGSGGEFFIVKNDGSASPYPLPNDGKYEIIVQKDWEDKDVTGLSGTLSGSQVIEYNLPSSDKIGNLPINRVISSNSFSNYTGSSMDIDTDNGSLTCSDGYISYYNDYDRVDYYYRSLTSTETDSTTGLDTFAKQTVSKTSVSGDLIDISGINAVFNSKDSSHSSTNGEWQVLCYQQGGNTTTTTIRQNDSTSSVDYFTFESASIIGDKYVAYCVSTQDSNGNYAKEVKFVDLKNPNSHIAICSSSELNSSDPWHPYYVKLSVSESGTPYLLVLWVNKTTPEVGSSYDVKTAIKIYNCENPSTCLVNFVTTQSIYLIKKVRDFKVLKYGSFYV